MEFFTADTHFGHERIIKYCNRPFADKQAMNYALIKNWNSVVSDEDTTYIIGDFIFAEAPQKMRGILSQLKGRKILILGNHDHFNVFNYIEFGFESAHTSLELHEFILVHDPAWAQVYVNRPALCGHVHQLFTRVGNVLNVGVDVHNFTPISIDYVRTFFENGVNI